MKKTDSEKDCHLPMVIQLISYIYPGIKSRTAYSRANKWGFVPRSLHGTLLTIRFGKDGKTNFVDNIICVI